MNHLFVVKVIGFMHDTVHLKQHSAVHDDLSSRLDPPLGLVCFIFMSDA